MTKRIACGALLLSSLPVVGCGTAVNLVQPGPPEGPKVPFGGVQHDVASIRTLTNGDLDGAGQPQIEKCKQMGKMLLCAVDIPFSFVGDVLTLPYTRAYTFINSPVPTTPLAVAPPGDQPPPVAPDMKAIPNIPPATQVLPNLGPGAPAAPNTGSGAPMTPRAARTEGTQPGGR